ncbi:MAG TPA: hypothetical protein VFW60_01430 [Rhodanobacteraceae bacterium]|nr:hypothetical protein [Rhodanobacteraceae bacterium]
MLAIGLALPSVAAAAAAPLPKAEVERAVVHALPAWHGKTAKVIKYLDLTHSFETVSQWALVAARDPTPAPPDVALLGNDSPIAICFVKILAPKCSEVRGHADKQWFDMTNALDTVAVVFAGPSPARPLLMLKTCSAHGLNGSCDIRTALFAYERKKDTFRQVFVNDSGGSNNNQAARFVEHGPLQGDVIVDYPTDHTPYTYWIEVYAPTKSGRYARILRYRGHTGYGDGNRLPVADSEMPEILGKLGLWKPGDALPVPEQMPEGCGRLVLRRGEEWCKKSLAGK